MNPNERFLSSLQTHMWFDHVFVPHYIEQTTEPRALTSDNIEEMIRAAIKALRDNNLQ